VAVLAAGSLPLVDEESPHSFTPATLRDMELVHEGDFIPEQTPPKPPNEAVPGTVLRDQDPTTSKDRRQLVLGKVVPFDEIVEVAERGKPDVSHRVILTGWICS